MFFTVGEKKLNEKSPAAQPLSVSRRAENNCAASEAANQPSSPRTAGLLQLAAQDGWHEERLSEGCNLWLTGDRYLLLCSTTSSRGPNGGVEAPGKTKRSPVTFLPVELATLSNNKYMFTNRINQL